MNTLGETMIPEELLARIQKAAERMDRLREQIFRRNGILDIGVPTIRELRDRE